MKTKLAMMGLLLCLSGCASAGSGHVHKEYYENGRLKLVDEDNTNVDALMQKNVVESFSTSTEDVGYKHRSSGKGVSSVGDADFVKAIAQGVAEGLKASAGVP